MKRPRPIIGVMGASTCNEEIADLAQQVGKGIAEGGGILLCGGGSGVMEAAARGAREAGGLTVGLLPGAHALSSPPNPFLDVPLFTGLGDGRNYVNAAASASVIAIAGAHGTLSEVALALKLGKAVTWLRPTYDLGDDVRVARDPKDAVEAAFAALPSPPGPRIR